MNKQLIEIKEALSKATPGKWEVNDFDTMYSAEIISEDPKGVFNGIATGMYVPNAHLIANATQWLASLVSQVEAATTALEDIIECSDIETAVQEIARNTLQSLKGEDKHE